MAETTKVHWTKSPITNRDMVLQEFDEKNGVCKMDLSSGYYTNETSCKYKKASNIDNIKTHEGSLSDIARKLRFDDGESYWYPSTIQTKDEIVFATGLSYEKIDWHYAQLKDGEMIETSIKHYDTYLEAIKQMNGHFLGDFTSGD